MIDHVFLFIYIISVGMTFAVVSLSLLYWLRRKNPGRFNTFVFISYLAVLLLLGGVRFYWEELLSGGRGVTIGTGMAEFAGYALLLYYLPATVNHIIGRKWTGLRRAAAITASTAYFALGVVYLFTGFLRSLSMSATLVYVLALAVILADIVLSIPKIRRGSARMTVLLVTLLTITFLPLMMASRLLEGSPYFSPSFRFLFMAIYYFWMALTGVVFYIREMSSLETAVNSARVLPDKLPLSPRERNVAESLSQGLTHGEIAENLGISPNTVRNHVSNVYKKLSVRSKVELIAVLRGERGF